MNWFVTGTDTGVGKTYVTTLLVRSLRRAGADAVAMKPICCGDRSDAEVLVEASGGSIALNDVNPVWFRPPLAPYPASMIESRQVDLELIREIFGRLIKTHSSVLVEGVGGWLVPIRKDYWVRDLAKDLGLPVVVVVRNRLGALNHALLTLESIRQSGLTCAGLILNSADEDYATSTNRAVLEDLADAPILFEVGPGQEDIDLAFV